MPKLKENQVPSYRRHKQSGQGIVTLSGKDHLLGRYNTKESRARYDRLIAEWLANGRRADYTQLPDGPSVQMLLADFNDHARAYYRTPEDKPAGEYDNFRIAMIPLKELYARTVAAQFGPRALRALQGKMVKRGWCRSYVNRQIGRIKQIFRWAASQELIPAAIYQALETVPGLRKGKAQVRESVPVRPVPEAWIEATIPHVSRQVGAMIRLQLLTGMRSGEVVIMSGGTLQTGSVVSTSSYDGLGRRISKAVSNSADWNCTYAYYHDGQRVIEIRNGSDQAIKQQVWGMQYVDELLQVGLNPSPSSGNTCSTMYWAMQDANWNVLGVVDSSGALKERYEYTPYGQRTVFFGPGSNDPGCYAATIGSRRFVTTGGVT
jgi:hypothetical protein